MLCWFDCPARILLLSLTCSYLPVTHDRSPRGTLHHQPTLGMEGEFLDVGFTLHFHHPRLPYDSSVQKFVHDDGRLTGRAPANCPDHGLEICIKILDADRQSAAPHVEKVYALT